MTVEISLHKTHRRHTDNKEVVEVEGNTVGECLRDLVKKYPPLDKEIFKNKRLNTLIEVYINGASAYPDELARPVRDGDKISLVYMLSSG
ncbi:MAG: MoaD/ThiS family protein [Deltaproteobacteria bacterium]|nr:MoaD/ThiS family protein [Deltaproteobacteria bacterium]